MRSIQIEKRTTDGAVVAIGVWLIYGLGYGPLHTLLGTHTGVTAFVPVVFTAWRWGAVAGAFAGLVSVPVTVLAALAAGVSDASWLGTPALIGAAAMIMVGYSVGHFRDLRAETEREVHRREEVESILRHERRRLSVVNEIATGLRGGDRTVDEVVSRAVQTLHRHFPQFRASYSTVDSDGRITILASVQPGGELATQVVATPLVLRPDQIERLIRSDLYQVDDVTKDIAWSKLSEVLGKIGTAALLDAPTRHPGVRTGLLSFSSSAPHAWTDLEKGALRDAADFLASTIEDVQRRLLLKESEARVRTLLEQNGDGVAVLLDGQVAYSNPAMTKMFGYDAEEFVSLDPLALIAPRHRAQAIERITGITSGDSVTGPSEYEGERKDGTTFPLEVMSRRILRDGRPALLSTMRDLTDRKRAESAAREAETKYRTLVEHSLAGVYVVQNRRFVYVNPKLAEIMGYDQNELIALPSAVAAIVADDRDIVEEKMTRRLAGATDSDHYYVRALRKSGEVIDLEIHSGSTTYIGRPATIGTVLDVTEQRRAEEQLRDSEVRFRTLFEEAPIGLVMTSLETRIQKVNQAFCDMLGYEETELIGRMVAEVTHPEDTGGTPESAKSVLGGAERIVRLHKRYIRKDGTSVEAETTLSLVKDSGGRPLYAVAMIEDVTEQRKLEDKLHQVLRLESVGQLAGGVAHNFNNALTAISGYSELLARRLDAEDPAMRDLEQIQRVAEQSAHLTRQLLAFSRQEDVHPSVFNLNEAVESTRDLLSPLLGDQLRIRLRLDRGLPSVSSDRTQLEQIITNLILNARDAMSQGGLLTIDTDAVEVDEAAARLNPEATPGRYVRMVVRDTGVGMQEETVARIFEPFFTTKEPGEGVGLGLAMVHGAVKQGGGFITVETTPDVGSTFTIFLPEFRETDTEERDLDLTPPTVH